MKRRKNNKKIVVSILVFAVAIYLILICLPRKNNDYKISQVGVDIPKGYTIHGIDVSRYQETIDWERVANFTSSKFSVDFAFIKATEGIELKDKYFSKNWTEAKKNDIICGAYHYFHANMNADLQADLFCKTVKLSSGDLAPVLDIEEKKINIDKNKMIDRCLIWLKKVEQHFGIKPIVYTYASFYESYFKGSKIEEFPLWIAHYDTNEPETSAQWQFWQHSDKANVDGINTKVDVNVFKGYRENLIKYCIK